MLNFRNTSIVFLVLLSIFAVAAIYFAIGYILMVWVAATYVFLLIFGSVFVCSGFYVKAYCKGDAEDKSIALTFDDGPHPVITPKILDILEKNGIKATFFVIGKNVTDHQGLMMRMVKEGHQVGNHSYSHSNFFDLWSSKQMLEDLDKAGDIIALATGQRPGWFRPPFGVTNPTVSLVTKKMDLKVMGWSIRSLDTSTRDPRKIMDRIRKKWHPGGIILLHDTNDRVIDVLNDIIDYAKQQGFNFVRADELVTRKQGK